MSKEDNGLIHYRAMFRHYPDALTPDQVREMLGIGRRLTYELLRDGRIPNVRVGRLYRVPKTAVIEYLCSQGQGSAQKRLD